MKNPNCSVMRYFHSSEHKCESRGWLGCTQELRTASRLLFAAFTILLLGGCVAVGPDYVPPETAVPGAWASQLCSGLRAGEMDPAEVARWWTKLGDPVLSNLVDRAVAGNLDLKEARARVREARARRGITRADRFPTMNTSASGSSKHTSEKSGSGVTRELYSAGFDASWEVDLFGGKQRAVEAAEAGLQASEEELRDVLVSIVAEVALNYVEFRTFQNRLEITEQNLQRQKETSEIAGWRCEAGLVTELDVERAKRNLEQTRSQIPPLQASLKRAENRLCVLLGQHPGTLEDILSERKPIPVPPLEVAVGVPADVLRRRPDVRHAERLLAASTAQVGVATAARFPTFSLAGSIGLEALKLGDLFSSGSRISSLASNIAWTIFDAGRIKQNIRVQSALQEQALIRYDAAVHKALEEVENALVAYAKEQLRRRSLLKAMEAAQRTVNLVRTQYASGVIDFQVVLDAERSLLTLQDQTTESEGKITSNLIRLYKALGGGWTPMKCPAACANEKK